MVGIKTFVFVDLETTGLPREELNKTKITEISMVAVLKEHILDTRKGSMPRVQNKLTLCLNPGRMVSMISTEITKLSNDLLEYQPYFDNEVYNILNKFLNILPKPVCMVAHNGYNFDFPIIKNHLDKLRVQFSDELYCADTFHFFYDMDNPLVDANSLNSDTINTSVCENLQNLNTEDDNERKKTCNNMSQEVLSEPNGINAGCSSDYVNNSDIICTPNKTDIILDINDSELEEYMASIDETKYINESTNMQRINETTPKQPITKHVTQQKRISKARRRLPWSGKKPQISYKLADVYEREFKESPNDLHSAEGDCLTGLKVAVAKSDKFVQWTEKNCVLFSNINPMTPGVRIGD
ncbi:three-prime repair exonuclease 1-like [Achroia grisella]|uniref:three-prime repair exonuclease 1-like n=1 Tax=Achroia grisella TaxID=688607 RepID=UPI0027D2CABC|nr:three-prime repair exonuclease 1-like [Achroia grisella]